MAYFAEIDDQGIVLRVLSVSNDNAPDPAPSVSEPVGRAFLASLGLTGTWVQTSFHGNFRGQFAGIGYRYDADADVFIAPQPYPSWTLDVNYDWRPPVPMPTEGGPWAWDESSLSWVEVTA